MTEFIFAIAIGALIGFVATLKRDTLYLEERITKLEFRIDGLEYKK